MKFNLKKFGLTAGLIGCVAGPLIGLTAPQAGAIPPAAHPGRTLAAAGSDTIYWVTGALQKAYNADKTVNTDHDVLNNIPPVVTAPFPSSYVTRKDSDCNSIRYSSSNLPPNGSSAGISALTADAASAHPGCIDYARSSRGPKSSDPATDQFYAFALDGLSWAKFPGSDAPASLTQQQLINIYTCDPSTGLPFVSDWSQVGGSPGTIIKFAPQTQAGTYAFWNSKILNGATIDAGCNSSHLSTFLEEHDARGVPSGEKTDAILPFSFAQWTAQANGVSPDLRNGDVLGQINGVTPQISTIKEANPHFLGTRYVFNVLNNTEPNYTDTMRYAGVDNAGPGWLCNNKANATLKKYGFAPLALANTGGGVTIKSYCRLNPAAL